MMIDTLSRLRWHAGLQKDGPPEIASISDCSWLPNKKSSLLDSAVVDALATLARLNLELNGSTPSVSTEKRAEIPRQLVWAIERVRSMLTGAAKRSTDQKEAAKFMIMEKKIAVAWAGVVAGDIDNLEEYINDQEWAQQ